MGELCGIFVNISEKIYCVVTRLPCVSQHWYPCWQDVWWTYFLNSKRIIDSYLHHPITSDSGDALSPVWCQAVTSTNAKLSSLQPLGTSFSEIWSKVQKLSFKLMYLKMLPIKCQPFSSGLSVLKGIGRSQLLWASDAALIHRSLYACCIIHGP